MDPDVKRRIDAIRFCQSSKSAVTLCVWPSASSPEEISYVKQKIQNYIGAKILYEAKLALLPHTAPLIMMAVYDGEDWLRTNCWYMEQPLKEGKPTGAWPGAKWKGALCFQEEQPMHIFVLDVSSAKQDLWSEKYSLRSELSQRTGYMGNSCMHVSDDQSMAVSSNVSHSGGYSCDESYAYHCCRIFLHPFVEAYLNKTCKDLNLDDSDSIEKCKFPEFLKWLKDGNQEDCDEAQGQFINPSL